MRQREREGDLATGRLARTGGVVVPSMQPTVFCPSDRVRTCVEAIAGGRRAVGADVTAVTII